MTQHRITRLHAPRHDQVQLHIATLAATFGRFDRSEIVCRAIASSSSVGTT